MNRVIVWLVEDYASNERRHHKRWSSERGVRKEWLSDGFVKNEWWHGDDECPHDGPSIISDVNIIFIVALSQNDYVQQFI